MTGRQLGAGLHLEHAHRVGAAQHVVDAGVGEVEFPQVDALPVLLLHQVDHVVQRLEHAEAQQVELHQAGGRAVVLVPLHDGTVLHPRPLHRHDVGDGAVADDHAAGVDA